MTCICKREVSRDYYYIEIVKGYLCLALNRHIVLRPVMFANAKINKWFAVRMVRLVLEDSHIHRLSQMVCV